MAQEMEAYPILSDPGADWGDSSTNVLRRSESVGSSLSRASEQEDPAQRVLGRRALLAYRLYMTYFFVTSLIVSFLFGLNCLLATLYSVFLPGLQQGEYTTNLSTTFAFSLLQSYLWGGILSLNVTCLRDFWKNDMLETRKNVARFVSRLRSLCDVRRAGDATDSELEVVREEITAGVAHKYLIFGHLFLVLVLPLVVAIATFLTDSRHRLHLAYSAWLFYATFAAMFVVGLRVAAVWVGSVTTKVSILRKYAAAHRPWVQFADSLARLEAFGLDYVTVAQVCTALGLLLLCTALFFGPYLGRVAIAIVLFLSALACLVLAAGGWWCAHLTKEERLGSQRGPLSSRKRLLYLIAVLGSYVVWLTISIISAFDTHWTSGLLFLALYVLTQGMFTRKRSKPVVDAAGKVVRYKQRNLMMGTFVVVYLCISVLLIVFGFSITGTPTPEKGHSSISPAPLEQQLDRYAICDFRWVRDNFTIIDFALLSQLAYTDFNSPAFSTDFTNWNFSGKLQVVKSESSGTGVTFLDFYDAANNASIVSIKGTEDGFDVLQDAQIWADSAVFQFSQALGPFVSIWPATLTESFINASAVVKKVIASTFAERYPVKYASEVEKYVQQIKPQRREVLLTGHSLGGGLAKLVGSKAGVRTVTFSAPGTMWVRTKEGITSTQVNKYGFSVVPMTDVVPKVDKLGGLVQYIECSLTYVNCHFLANTICELLRTCGDPIPGTDQFGYRMNSGCNLERGCVC